MATSSYWRDFEHRFEKLQPRPPEYPSDLDAIWNENSDPQWVLSYPDEVIRKRFEWLCKGAAMALGHDGPNPVFYWLGLLRRDSPRYKRNEGTIRDANGNDISSESGVIECVCLASAEYCLRCEVVHVGPSRDIAIGGQNPWSQKLRDARKSAGLSRPKVVRKLKERGATITVEAVTNHEKGTLPRAEVRSAYAAIYDKSIEELFSQIFR